MPPRSIGDRLALFVGGLDLLQLYEDAGPLKLVPQPDLAQHELRVERRHDGRRPRHGLCVREVLEHTAEVQRHGLCLLLLDLDRDAVVAVAALQQEDALPGFTEGSHGELVNIVVLGE